MNLSRGVLRNLLSNKEIYTNTTLLEAYEDIKENPRCGPALSVIEEKINLNIIMGMASPHNADDFVYWDDSGNRELLVELILEEIQMRNLAVIHD